MSRIGKIPVKVPDGVQVSLAGGTITVKGRLGTLSREYKPEFVSIIHEGGELRVEQVRPEDKRCSQYQGLYRALVANMVEGVSKGYAASLEIVGVGYKATLAGSTLNLALGHSHPVAVELPAGMTAEVVQKEGLITLRSHDKEVLGQVAARIRAWRPPEPYKGKGVRYKGENIRRKASKAGAK